MVKENYGYLPEERPTTGKLLLYALQQVIVMFPATITVALITGFQVSTTIFASGLATLCFIFITGKKIPLYYGSSFAYLSAVASMAMAEGTEEQLASWQSTGILPTELISKAQFGIIMSGFVSIAAGLLVRKFGKDTIEKILPPSITGPISMIIGLTLAGNALSDAIPAQTGACQCMGGRLSGNAFIHSLLFKVFEGIPRTDPAASWRSDRFSLRGSLLSHRRSRL